MRVSLLFVNSKATFGAIIRLCLQTPNNKLFIEFNAHIEKTKKFAIPTKNFELKNQTVTDQFF